MPRYIKRELVQPIFLTGLPTSEWTDDEKRLGKSTRKRLIDPIDTADILFAIAITAVTDAALSSDDIRASIGLQDAIDPKHKGEPTCEMDGWIKLEDNEYNYLIKKLDARNWITPQLRETLEMIQSWREADTHIPGELTSIAGRKKR